ncbi:Serine/threonine protein kinase [Thermostaphylospora chromogena]|uniref:non-specific serine/threonine protein kinase n=1 Tax=Thermostaphylospora chromogena TaxID=35622 RepID=A0A1H1DX51_9ACTN|nr:Serine/threonine protein kinase [Thermostaphylospora chromogena]
MKEGDVLTRRYRLLERIASGGMSAIWRAFDQSLHRMVAVKVLDRPLDADHGERELIRREARAAARIIHPDAIEVYDYGETVTSNGRMAAFVVMRLLDGTPLADRIADGPLPWQEAVTIAARVAKVLAAAHERGIVHRDVTAENVLITPDGAKLLDFGIAAFVGEQASERVADYGTPPYVAPERLAGVITDPAVDVYSLGVLLFEMLTGDTPYPERTWEEIENARREGPPPLPDVPGLPTEVAMLCRRCLDADPRNRPTAQHVADVLTESIAPQPETGLSRGLASGVAIALTVSAVLAIVGWTDTMEPVREQPLAAVSASLGPPVGEPTVSAEPVDRSEEARVRTEPVASPLPNVKAYREPETRSAPIGEVEEPLNAAPIASVTLPDAVDAFSAAVQAAQDRSMLQEHVAVDLRQVADNLIHDADTTGVLSTLREKVDTRHREGLLPEHVHRALQVRLDVIEKALESGGPA